MIEKEYNSNRGLFFYTISCDGNDCEETLPPKDSDTIALMVAIEAGWKRLPIQKFSGIAQEDLCPACRKKQGITHEY